MILINLLPDEYRRQRRTPVKLMLVSAAAVAVNASLLAYWGWLAFGVTAGVQSQRDVLRLEMDSITPQIAYHRELEGENRTYESRESTLASITQGRVSWTRKMDELIDVINMGGGGEKYLIWLEDLSVSQKSDARQKTFGFLKASAYSGSSNFAQLANFLEDLEEHSFISDFYKPAPPEGQRQQKDEDLIPSEYWTFPLSVDLMSPEEREARRVEQAKNAAEGQEGAEPDAPETASEEGGEG
jgi:Tfp pilus assembly protein PilN